MINHKSHEDYVAEEILKCRMNILYFIDTFVKIPESGGEIDYKLDTTNKKLKRFIRSTMTHKRTIMMASRQLGKALSLDTPIPLPDGKWTTMGEISVGDVVLSKTGNPTNVIGVTNNMFNHDCYEIEFDNGEKIIADAGHLWEVSNSSTREKKVIKKTEELYNRWNIIKKWKNAAGFRIELSGPVDNSEKNLPLDPYLLGLWLGDGSNYDSRISTSLNDYSEISVNLENKGYSISEFRDKSKYGQPNSGTFNVYKILSKLRELNLLQNKHIPDIYMGGSINQKLELLRGLMDSDGHAMKSCGHCQFYQKSYHLLFQVRMLLSSLGVKTKITSRIIDEETYYQLGFTTNKFEVFNLSRKVKNQKVGGKRQENYNVYIKNITKVSSVPVKCISVDASDNLFLCGKTMIPTHNSTINGIILLWATMFFPRNNAVIINMKKESAIDNLKIIKFVHENLPEWLRVPMKYKGERKTFIEFVNGSSIKTFYVSAATPPETIARGLTVPIITIDECAFVSKIEQAYGAATPAISKAREQALKNGYPTFTTIISTPNGTVGDGEFFYKLYTNAIDSDEIYYSNDEEDNPYGNEELINNHMEIMDDQTRNGFVKVDYLWNEDPTKNEKWFQKMKQDLNFDTRRINQEINCLFVGSTGCIFDDDLLSQMVPKKPIEVVRLPHMSKLNIYRELDSLDYLIVGVDTAKSLTGDYTAIEIYGYRDFEQVAEYTGRLGSLSKFKDVVKAVVDYLIETMGDRIILAIENNSYGASIIEWLEEDKNPVYNKLIYTVDPKKGTGINTNAKTKPMMVTEMYDQIVSNTDIVHSKSLINQLTVIEKKASGTVSAQRGAHDDLFMASAFCAYVKKISSLEFDSKIGMTNKQIKEKNKSMMNSIFVDTKQVIQNEIDMEKYASVYGDFDENDNEYDDIIMPMLL